MRDLILEEISAKPNFAGIKARGADDVVEGLAVEADRNYTVALDLKITPELRQSCMAREFVNRIQNRRKEMDLQITDKIRISV